MCVNMVLRKSASPVQAGKGSRSDVTHTYDMVSVVSDRAGIGVVFLNSRQVYDTSARERVPFSAGARSKGETCHMVENFYKGFRS